MANGWHLNMALTYGSCGQMLQMLHVTIATWLDEQLVCRMTTLALVHLGTEWLQEGVCLSPFLTVPSFSSPEPEY